MADTFKVEVRYGNDLTASPSLVTSCNCDIACRQGKIAGNRRPSLKLVMELKTPSRQDSLSMTLIRLSYLQDAT